MSPINSRCNNELRQIGQHAIPRTCAECGLGPCKYEPKRSDIRVEVIKSDPSPVTRFSINLEWPDDPNKNQIIFGAVAHFMASILTPSEAVEVLKQFKEKMRTT